jgi:ferredoxin
MEYNSMKEVYFSPTGTTKTIVGEVTKYFSRKKEIYNLLADPPEEEIIFGDNDFLVVGMPVYAGRIPAVCVEMLSKIKGQNTPVIAVVVYGNREYDDALLELKTILEENGFVVISAGAFVAQHSIFPGTGYLRPDIKDKQAVRRFAKESCEKFESALGIEEMSFEVKGNFPYKEPGKIPLVPSVAKTCNKCGACIKVCPVNAILTENPQKLNKKLCIRCTACFSVCPSQNREFRGALYALTSKIFEKKFSVRREPEVFL